MTLAALVVATAFRFFALGKQSLWADELFSVYWAKAGAGFMLGHIRDETNPPLYYFLLQAWMGIFGDSETAVRLLSAVLSAITVPVVYSLGKGLFGRSAGAIAALLYALSYWHLYYAQEARGYALFNLLFAVALKCLLQAIAELACGTKPSRVAFGGYGTGLSLALVALCYTHYVGSVVVAALGLATALAWWRLFAFDRRFLTCFATIGAGVAILIAPAVVVAIADSQSPNMTWLMPPSFGELGRLALGAPMERGSFGAVSLAMSAALWLPLFVYGAWRHRNALSFFLVYLLPAIGFGLLVLVSYCYAPVLLDRTVLWLSIPVYLGLAGAASAVKLASARRVVAVTIVASSMVSAAGYFRCRSEAEPWRSLIAQIAAKVSDRDLVVLGSDTPATAFLYYGGAKAWPALTRWPASVTAADALDEHETGIRPINSEVIAATAKAGRRVIFISRTCAVPAGFDPATALFRPRSC